MRAAATAEKMPNFIKFQQPVVWEGTQSDAAKRFQFIWAAG